MTTQVINLTRAWTQLTTGVETKTVSNLDGSGVVFFDSATQPAADATGHPVIDNALITPPASIWARAGGNNARLVVS